MKRRPPRGRTLVLLALAGSAVAVGTWLFVSTSSSGGTASPRSAGHGPSTARPGGPLPVGPSVPSASTRPGVATTDPVSARTPPGLHLPAHPTGTQHPSAASTTSAPALVRLTGIEVGGRCSMPNFPARTSDGTAVVCSSGTWKRR